LPLTVFEDLKILLVQISDVPPCASVTLNNNGIFGTGLSWDATGGRLARSTIPSAEIRLTTMAVACCSCKPCHLSSRTRLDALL
jgi:hypothetical protein